MKKKSTAPKLDVAQEVTERTSPRITPAQIRATMERSMGDLSKLLASQNFKSKEDLEAFLNTMVMGQPIPEPKPETPLEMAQDLIYKAHETASRKGRIKLAQKALEISPDCVDAYVILAEEAESLLKRLEILEQGKAAGERAIGAEQYKSWTGNFWLATETRPYMRACEGIGEIAWALGRLDHAIEVYQLMLRLNPSDNQGVRYQLANCLLEVGDTESAQQLLKQFDDDAAANWAYSRALMLFLKRGDGPIAAKALDAAINTNVFVPDLLLRHKRLPRELPPYIGFGDESEAVAYVAYAARAWENANGALAWLRQYRAQSDTH